MGIEISQLPAITAPALTDIFPVSQGTTTYKETILQLISLFSAQPGLSFTTPNIGVATATSINFGGVPLSTYSGLTAWTPVFSFSTPGNLTVSYATQVGSYNRIGNIVYINFTLICTPTFTTSSGYFLISGLPFPANAATGNNATGAVIINQIASYPASTSTPVIAVLSGTSYIAMYGVGVGGNVSTTFTTANFTSTVAVTLIGSLTYMV